MQWSLVPLAAFLVACSAFVSVFALRPSLLEGRGGAIAAWLAFLVFPALGLTMGGSAHLEHSKTTHFCLSCHVMKPYGESLHVADEAYLPASHFQNARVHRETACYDCHTTYTMYGDLRAKLKGFKHVMVNYLGEIPERLHLYEPYANRECLHCHSGARSYEESFHGEMSQELDSGETSCLECHELTHPIEELDRLPMWEAER